MLSTDVYVWIDRGWVQPNCGVVVDPLVLWKVRGAKGALVGLNLYQSVKHI
jgi:hypothetical protein